MKPLPRWDNGRDVVLAGDAAGVVAPASGEGIYYAMYGGRWPPRRRTLPAPPATPARWPGAQALHARARPVFWVLGMMQRFWYSSDKRRERFVSICKDRDVQQLTFESYMNKELVRKKPMAHVRIFFKDVAHLLGLARVLAAKGVAARREMELLADPPLPMAFAALRLGATGPCILLGHDLRPEAAMQQRFLRAQRDLEQGYQEALDQLALKAADARQSALAIASLLPQARELLAPPPRRIAPVRRVQRARRRKLSQR
jgi:hypothetical protein